MEKILIKTEHLVGKVNLADASLGAEAVQATDEFFAAKERMLSPTEPVFHADTFDDHGQWMDGWETRRRRDEGYDSCTVKLAYPGVVNFVDLDTRYFTGNYAPQASIEGTAQTDCPDADTAWTEILPVSSLAGDDHNLFRVSNQSPWQYLRLNIIPDGGIARFRVYGDVCRDWAGYGDDEVIDLFAIENGGVALECNDQHYGDIALLNRPGRGKNMSDAWETRRRREPGFDWVILKLGHSGFIKEVEIDTAHHRGNYPNSVSLNAALVHEPKGSSLAASSINWPSLMAPQPMRPHDQHHFKDEILSHGAISHVRVNLHPDGGISRVRLYGVLAR